MYYEGAPEFTVDQGLYYPAATNYGYLCTGLESPGNWSDHHGIFVLDGQDIPYAGSQNECLPYMYYATNYGYVESSYNPYNPYIPGAVIGVDGPQYHNFPSYENPVSSTAYMPMVVQSNHDSIPNGMRNRSIDNAVSVNRFDGQGHKQNLSSKSSKSARASVVNVSSQSVVNVSSQSNSFRKVDEGTRGNARSSDQPFAHGSGTSAPALSHIHGGQGFQPLHNVTNGKASSGSIGMRVTFPSGNGLSGSELSDYTLPSVDAVRPSERFPDDVKGSRDVLDHKLGPKINKSKNQLVVKAYTTRAGDTDALGNITIYTNQYGKDDFAIDYVNAKFFVIKSYSEDDVHKSIKYNVWSSTPNGNKKLNNAYEDAQRIAGADLRGCPIFLFFSVNASGQFCGVAEMTGPVDFYRDMDFWQQDKWTGSFPVKWHMVKDVSNPNFRHIILENNENKPVTNSRDTQEISYRKGMEMLKLFKNYKSSTSLLDDFMYYENRQRIMQEERSRLRVKSHGNSYLLPFLDPPRRLSNHDLPSGRHEEITKHNVNNSNIVKGNLEVSSGGKWESSEKNAFALVEQASLYGDVDNSDTVKENTELSTDAEASSGDELKIGSLTIKSIGLESESPSTTTAVNGESVDVVTVGSLQIKVNNTAESSSFLTIGTIPLDPRALGGHVVDSSSKKV